MWFILCEGNIEEKNVTTINSNQGVVSSNGKQGMLTWEFAISDHIVVSVGLWGSRQIVVVVKIAFLRILKAQTII